MLFWWVNDWQHGKREEKARGGISIRWGWRGAA